MVIFQSATWNHQRVAMKLADLTKSTSRWNSSWLWQKNGGAAAIGLFFNGIAPIEALASCFNSGTHHHASPRKYRLTSFLGFPESWTEPIDVDPCSELPEMMSQISGSLSKGSSPATADFKGPRTSFRCGDEQRQSSKMIKMRSKTPNQYRNPSRYPIPNSPGLHGQIHLNPEKYVFASPSAPKKGDAGCMIHCSYLEELWRILTFIISQPYHS